MALDEKRLQRLLQEDPQQYLNEIWSHELALALANAPDSHELHQGEARTVDFKCDGIERLRSYRF